MKQVLLNGKYNLTLPDHRAERPEWITGWEVERIESMMANIEKGDLVLDIGTEEGDISALLAQKTGKIMMFEPNPLVWTNIRAIWEANNLPKPTAIFVGFASSITDLKDGGVSFDWPKCAYGELIGNHGFKELKDPGEIPQIKIDDFMYDILEPLKMITMDVEGSEFEVLKGARETLLRHKPLVYVSVHPAFMADNHRQNYPMLKNYMEELGFEENYLTYDHELHILFKFNNEKNK